MRVSGLPYRLNNAISAVSTTLTMMDVVIGR
jgi:hypothetical protein